MTNEEVRMQQMLYEMLGVWEIAVTESKFFQELANGQWKEIREIIATLPEQKLHVVGMGHLAIVDDNLVYNKE